MENKIYTGIGSRSTPVEVMNLMTELAQFLTSKGYILRSGGANGADKAFEAGVSDVDLKEIYLPWKGFNDHPSLLYNISDEAYTLAQKYHPAWDKLSTAAKKLIARDGYQVLGRNLKSPSEFVACWTKMGKITGGTGQALRIAKDKEIPIYNLFFDDDQKNVKSWISSGAVTHGH